MRGTEETDMHPAQQFLRPELYAGSLGNHDLMADLRVHLNRQEAIPLGPWRSGGVRARARRLIEGSNLAQKFVCDRPASQAGLNPGRFAFEDRCHRMSPSPTNLICGEKTTS